jgi:hypothetical protein
VLKVLALTVPAPLLIFSQNHIKVAGAVQKSAPFFSKWSRKNECGADISLLLIVGKQEKQTNLGQN